MKYIIKEQVLITYLKVVVKIKEGRLDLSSSHFYFILFYFQFIFLFLEKLGLELISYTVTSVTT